MNALHAQLARDIQMSADPIKKIYVAIGSQFAEQDDLFGIPVQPHPSVPEDRYFLDKGTR